MAKMVHLRTGRKEWVDGIVNGSGLAWNRTRVNRNWDGFILRVESKRDGYSHCFIIGTRVSR